MQSRPPSSLRLACRWRIPLAVMLAVVLAPAAGARAADWQWAPPAQPGPVHVNGGFGAVTVKDSPLATERPYVFVSGTDGNLWLRWWDGSNWHWRNQGTPSSTTTVAWPVGATTVKDTPNGPQRPYVFVLGLDHQLYVNWWTGTDWRWRPQGAPPGGLAAGIGVATYTAVAGGPERPYAFLEGLDGRLWANYWTGSDWAWYPIGTPPGQTDIPYGVGAATVMDGPNATERPYVFVYGHETDQQLWAAYWDGSGWQWHKQGAPANGLALGVGATAVADSPQSAHRPYVFVYDRKGQLWANYWTNSAGWQWYDVGTPGGHTLSEGVGVTTVMDDPSAPQRPYVFVRDFDIGHLWLADWDSSGWHWRDQGAPSSDLVLGSVGATTVTDSTSGPERPEAFVFGTTGPLWTNYWG